MPSADRLIAAAGALALAIGTAAAAVSAHLADAGDALRLDSASRMLLVHGVGLWVLALARSRWSSVSRPLGWIALLLAVGLALFAGSLLLAVLLDTTTSLAPLGGSLIILCWLAVALLLLAAARRQRQ
ncbi:MAG: DUF423 domain-containing protein [Lysobacteraceae bacterium]